MNLDTLSLQQFNQPLSEITDRQVFERSNIAAF